MNTGDLNSGSCAYVASVDTKMSQLPALSLVIHAVSGWAYSWSIASVPWTFSTAMLSILSRLPAAFMVVDRKRELARSEGMLGILHLPPCPLDCTGVV